MSSNSATNWRGFFSTNFYLLWLDELRKLASEYSEVKGPVIEGIFLKQLWPWKVNYLLRFVLSEEYLTWCKKDFCSLTEMLNKTMEKNLEDCFSLESTKTIIYIENGLKMKHINKVADAIVQSQDGIGHILMLSLMQ